MKVNSGPLWPSMKRAFTVTAAVYFLLAIGGLFIGDPTTPLLNRFPLAWIWYWPKLFLAGSATVTDRDLIVSLVLNIAAYTILIYAISFLMNNRRHAGQ
jgi:hypothetical protein